MSHAIEIREEAGVRTLHFGSNWVQGAMRVARPWHLELEYTREMMLPLLLGHRHPGHVLLIGLGAASLTKFLYRHCPRTRLTVVEIDDNVTAAARQFFKLPHDPDRLEILHADGVAFLQAASDRYDGILVDGFDDKARAGALESLDFYRQCRLHLADEGFLAVNLLGKNRGFRGAVERLQQAFQSELLVLPPGSDGNVVALASPSPLPEIDIHPWREQARAFRQDTGLNLLPTLSRLEAETQNT